MALPIRVELGEEHYRRSEESWREVGRPRSTVAVARVDDEVVVTVVVPRSARRFVAIDQENPLDNDPAAIHGDGLQLYVDVAGHAGGWLLVPIADSADVGMRAAEGWSDELEAHATWNVAGDGYELEVRIPLPEDADSLALDVLVNVTGPGRTRRHGQLVLSGAHGEFVYLRSDRHDRERLVALLIGN